MIREVFSSLPTFKRLQFHAGLNILVADKTNESTSQDTRNRAGKSSFVELVHFVLGGKCDPKDLFRSPQLSQHRFGMAFDLRSQPVSAERAGASHGRVRAIGDVLQQIDELPQRDPSTGKLDFSVRDWRHALGRLMFGLSDTPSSDQPKFRELISYFARRADDGGAFLLPEKHHSFMSSGDWQQSISFLLGLDWTVSRDLEHVRARERQVLELKKQVGEGLLSDVLGKSSVLRSELAAAEARVADLRRRLEEFRVHAEYRELENEAAGLAARISQLASDNVMDRRWETELVKNMEVEAGPESGEVERLYREAGINLGDSVIRRFDDVRAFHESIVRNRRSYLDEELLDTKSRISLREKETQRLEERRGEVLRVLKSHGALDTFIELQSELGKRAGRVEALRKRWEAMSAIEATTARATHERQEILLRLQRNLEDSRSVVDEVAVLFNSISAELYKEPAILALDPTPDGLKVVIQVRGGDSGGIAQMQVFTFDLMLSCMVAKRGIGPGFLIHDSHLFDPVDARQIGVALVVAERMSREYGFQYIVTMNSDRLAETAGELPAGFDLNKFILSPRLTDATVDGGLFGIRF